MAKTLPVGGAKFSRQQSGFTYITIVVMVTLLAIGAGVTNTVTSTLIKRGKETELLYQGGQFVQAIQRYYEAGVPNQYPRDLSALLRDPRFPYKVHIRKIFKEPFSRQDDAKMGWQLITNTEGGIIGVASQSSRKPLKNAKFPDFVRVEGEGTEYAHWQFVFIPNKAQVPSTINTFKSDTQAFRFRR